MKSKLPLLQGIVAYAMWGLLPIYWHWFNGIDPYFIFVCRCIWIVPFLFVALVMRGELNACFSLFKTAGHFLRTIACAALIGLNWLIYVKGVQENRVIELGLGYFLSPVLSVLLGYFFNGERLGRWRLGALGFVLAGAAVYGLKSHGIPAYALGIAATFALYGFLRKRQPVSPMAGQGAEAIILAVFGLAWLATGQLTTLGDHPAAADIALLISTGLATAVPLVIFAAAAKMLEVSTLGMLTFVSPTIKVVVATLVLGESFGRIDAAAMMLIWVGLVCFFAESYVLRKRRYASASALTISRHLPK